MKQTNKITPMVTPLYRGAMACSSPLGPPFPLTVSMEGVEAGMLLLIRRLVIGGNRNRIITVLNHSLVMGLVLWRCRLITTYITF